MDTIFVSYRRDDTAGHAGRLYDRLAERFGEEALFRDIDSIQYGEDFVEALDEAVGSCKAMISVIGPNWLKSEDKRGRRRLENAHDFVRLEIESALARGIPIYPVTVGDAEMPDADELPESIAGLVRRQALEISETRFDYDVGELIGVLENRIDIKTKPNVNVRSKGKNRDSLPSAQKLSKELENEPFPPSVKHKLSEMNETIQLRFLDIYRQHKKTNSIAYLLLFFPLPIFGLHNYYLDSSKRLYLFWFVEGIFVFSFLAYPMNIFSLIGSLIWPIIDLFLLRKMVRNRNDYIAQEMLFGDPSKYEK